MVNQYLGPRWLLIVLLGLLVTGCASMDEDECRVADWRAIGYEDGVSGKSPSHIGERREACAEYGVAPDFVAYRQGRDEGLREYCTPASGYRLGRNGRPFTSVCPASLQADFLDAYKSGREIYQAAAVVNSTRSKLKRKKHELEDIRSSITSGTAELVSPDTGTDRRIELVVELQDLHSRKSAVERQIDRLRIALDRHRHRLAALEQTAVY